MRPIDADALLKGKEDHEMISTHLIFNAPTLDVKPVIKGEWDIQYDMDGKYGICSVCGMDTDFTHYGKAYKICPHCGADMRESEDKE